MKGPAKQMDRHVDAVLASLDILDCFLSTPSLTIKKCIEQTGLTRNRVMRLIGTLLSRGYLIEDKERTFYLPGPKFRALSKVFDQANGMVLLARPILRQVVLKTGESASLFIREGLERVVLAREEGTQIVRYYMTEGQRMELYHGASGKVLLAYAPEEIVDALMAVPAFARRTANTITDPAALLKEIHKVRRQGYAESAGERIADAFAVAAPVFDGTGNIEGALGLAGPRSRFTPDVRKQYIRIIVDAAQELSRQLGWQRTAEKQEMRNE